MHTFQIVFFDFWKISLFSRQLANGSTNMHNPQIKAAILKKASEGYSIASLA